jgi:imidazolonepropionase
MADAGIRTGVAVLVHGDTIAAVAPESELRANARDATIVDCGGGVLSPGFVDSHTHAVFGRARYEEQELRATGVSYQEIAQRGGGIQASVRDLRARSEDELFALAAPRLMRLAASGGTTVEVKSGYGLTLDDELKTLRVIRRLGDALPDSRIGLQHEDARAVGDELDLDRLPAGALAQIGHVAEDHVPARRIVVGDLEERPIGPFLCRLCTRARRYQRDQ